MDDDITSGMGQDMAQAAQGPAPEQDPTQQGGDPSQGGGQPPDGPSPPGTQDPTQGAPQGPVDFIQQAQDAHQNQPVPQDQAAGSEQDPRPVGTREQADAAASQKDPYAAIQATPEEQALYTQLVTRFILFVHDMRKVEGSKQPSPLEQVLALLNKPDQTVPQAVGVTTATMMYVMHTMAKVQKIDYPPDVMYHAVSECCAAIYLIGQARGIFKGTPPYQGMNPQQWKHSHSDQDMKDANIDEFDYPFSQADIKLIAKAGPYAAKEFGRLMQQHGQLDDDDRTEASQFWQQNIRREVHRGVVGKDIMERLQKGGVVDAHAQQAEGQ